MSDLLEVRLGEQIVGKLTRLTGDRSFFAFDEAPNRPVLSQSFFAQSGAVVPETRTVQTKLPPFFVRICPVRW